jgi:tRNA wybutosine-synthesizing protein 3
MNFEKGFFDCKEMALKSLEKASLEKKVDKKILSVLNIINKSGEYYTTSSCSGRIVLLEIPSIGDKRNARFVGIWHRKIKPKELKLSLKNAKTGLLLLLAQPPIIHISAKTNISADKMIKLANGSGFKNSGFKSIDKKFVVEVCSTERLDAPIGKNGTLFCDDEYLDLLVEISNEVIEKSASKLKRFKEELKKNI